MYSLEKKQRDAKINMLETYKEVVKMRHSIKTKFSLMIFACLLMLVAAIMIMNTLFLDKYYMRDKQKTFENAYNAADGFLNDFSSGKITYEEFADGLEEITATSNIALMILNNDWSYEYVSMHDAEGVRARLQNYLFTKILYGDSFDEKIKDIEVVAERENYSIYEIFNARMNDTYMELIGTTTNGKMIYMSLAVKSIEENVDISNRFIIRVGFLVALVGAFAAFMLGSVIAKPIKKLSVIAEKMSELDFDAVYEDDDLSEIGHLGKSMNKLSSKLEHTISELKSANVELKKDIETKEQIDEMRKEFLSNVSHELKTPIALIQGYAEALKEGIADDPESMEFYCDVIVDEAGKMNSMVKKLLTLNQMEFGKEQLEMERVDILEVVRAVVDANRLPAEQKGIDIVYEEQQNVSVWADEYKVEEVITNYITNAINHCKNEMQIRIDVVENGGVARISVFNTGDAIPDEELSNIWTKFYKVDKARTREYGGSGIGLSIVKAIMEQHNQQFGVINHENGVEFWFELDAATE